MELCPTARDFAIRQTQFFPEILGGFPEKLGQYEGISCGVSYYLLAAVGTDGWTEEQLIPSGKYVVSRLSNKTDSEIARTAS